MKLNRVDHIGVVVDNIEEATALLGQGFGLEAGSTVQREDLCNAFFRCGDVSIEVIEIRDPVARRARLGEHQRARIEHIAIEVDDLDAMLHALEVLGVRPQAPPRLSWECDPKLHRACLVADLPSGRNRTAATE